MPDRVYRALDMLAGVAGQEIDEARQFKHQELIRQKAIARKQAEANREFEFKEKEAETKSEEFQKTYKLKGESQDELARHNKAMEDIARLRIQQENERESRLNQHLSNTADRALLSSLTSRLNNLYSQRSSLSKSFPMTMDIENSLDEINSLIEEMITRYNTTAQKLGEAEYVPPEVITDVDPMEEYINLRRGTGVTAPNVLEDLLQMRLQRQKGQ